VELAGSNLAPLVAPLTFHSVGQKFGAVTIGAASGDFLFDFYLAGTVTFSTNRHDVLLGNERTCDIVEGLPPGISLSSLTQNGKGEK
jgi:hypothetical protein